MDLEKAKKALINAHNAGDTVAAKKLANFIKQNTSLNATQEQKPSNLTEKPRTLSDIGMEGVRKIGQAGRTVTAGLSSLADVPLLLPKTLASGGEVIAETIGMENTPAEQFLQKIRSLPTMAESTKGVIDQATGGTLKPKDFAETIIMGGGELAFGLGPYGKTGSMVDDAPTVMSAVKSVIEPTRLVKKAPIPLGKINRMTSDEVRKQASELYKQADEIGGILKPEITNKWLKKVMEGDFKNPLVKQAQQKLGGSVPSKVREVFQIFENQPMTLDMHQQIDELLGELATYDMGKPTKEGLQILKMQQALREFVEQASDADVVGGKEGFKALKEARKLWSRSLKLRDVERIIQRAEMMDVPATGIKSGFRTLANNPERMRGFTLEEQKAIRKAGTTGDLEDIAKTFGSRLVSIGSSIMGPKAGLVGYAGSTSLRKGLEAYKYKQANDILDMISGVKKPLKPVSKKQEDAVSYVTNLLSRVQSQGQFEQQPQTE